MKLVKNKSLVVGLRLLLVLTGLFVLTAIILFNYETEVTANQHEYVYELPFRHGESFKVVQGYGGLFSHSHIAALDFAMPEGTPVHASRDGVVYSYRDDSDRGGMTARYKNDANYIMIRHDDGSFGCYWHLQKGGVLIKKGRVRKGQQIGLSGATGQVVRPHLHFSVKKKLNYQRDSFVRTRFRTSKGIQFLEKGSYYERPVGN